MQIFGYEIGFFYARKAKVAENRSVTLTNPAAASYFGFNPFSSDISVTKDSVLGIPPVWSAIRYISEGIASLSQGVFFRDASGDVFPDYKSPIAYLFGGRPHPHYTAFDFFQTLISNACLGNGYARIHFDPTTARPSALEIIPQEFVKIQYSSNGNIYYLISGSIDNKSVNVVIPETEMLHIKGVTFTGVNGKRVELVHSGVFSTALGAQQYSNTYFESGAAVGGLITFPNPLSPDQRKVLRERIESQHMGSQNAGSMMVLDAGADFKPMQAGPKDAAVVDFRNLSTVEVSQIFKVPLHMLSQLAHSTFSNMEQQSLDFVAHCLRPWCAKIEAEINTKLFTDSEIRNRRRFFAFNLDAVMMGDMQAQAQFFASAIQNGWMTPNEVRAKKNLNRIDGGDQLFIQQNMAPMQDLHDILEAKYGQDQAQAQNNGNQADQADTPDPNSNDAPSASNGND